MVQVFEQVRETINHSVLRNVTLLVISILLLNFAILGAQYFFNEKKAEQVLLGREYHLTTDNNIIKLLKDIDKINENFAVSSSRIVSAADSQTQKRLDWEFVENVKYVVSSRVNLVFLNHEKYQQKRFSGLVERLRILTEQLMEIGINNRQNLEHDIHISTFNQKLDELIIVAKQLQILHENAYLDLLQESKDTQHISNIVLYVLILGAMVMVLWIMKLSYYHIRKALYKQQLAMKEVDSLNSELELRIDERTQDLKATNEQLQASLEKLQHAQKQLIESEKMAALGGLVAGVAHEINTPIGVGVSAISYLASRVKEYSNLYESGNLTKDDFERFLQVTRESSDMVQANLGRAAQLIQSFKRVSVDQSHAQIRKINIKSYLNEIAISLAPKFKTTRHIMKIECADDIEICLNPGDFSQVISNLVINSLIHGFDGVDEGVINIDVIALNGVVEIHYHDNGVGISEEIADHIFEPFFTTKRDSGGSGLGMHIVYNLITQALGGTIVLCQKDSSQGTRFVISIPISHEQKEQQVA